MPRVGPGFSRAGVRAEAVMGTTVSIEVVRGDTAGAIDRAFDWFHLVERTCTRFDPLSELWQLTRRVGEPVAVSTLLFEAIQFALHVAEASGGAFDPTVGAAMQRRGFNHEHRTRQEAPRVDAGDAVSWRDVAVDADARTVTLRVPLLLDLGAVAKGLAVDLAARELQPLEHFAIDAGGDVFLAGHNTAGEPWSIGIRHPTEAGAIIDRVRVSNQAVCTSGTYARGDHLVHAGNAVSATVIASTAMLADALSTAAFVLGPERGVALLESMDVDGLIIDDTLRLFTTSHWPRLRQGSGETGP